jgi:hypothetical protein
MNAAAPAPPLPFDPTQLITAFFQAINKQLQMNYQQYQASLTQGFVFSTGAGVSFQQPLVMKFWQTNVLIADVALALVVLWIGYQVILGFYEPLQMLSRVILAAVAVHASLEFIGLFVQLNNVLCASAFATGALPTTGDIVALFLPVPGANPEAFVLQTTLIFLMGIVVMLQDLVRVGLLDLLIVISPFALLLYISPGTQQWANLWFSAFFATLFLQFLQVLAIVIGAGLVANSPLSAVSTLAGIGVLIFVLQIPRWLGSAVTSGALGSVRSPFGYLASAAREAAQGFLTLIRLVP